LDQTAKSNQGIGDGFLDLVFAVLAAEAAKCDFGMDDNLRQHGKELGVPAATGGSCAIHCERISGVSG
jgi:hypothetical protein